MADSQQIERAVDQEPSTTSFAAGLIIVAFTLAVGILCVIVLASTLIQTRISGLAIDGVPLTVWKLDTIRQAWDVLRDKIDMQTSALTSAELRLREATYTASAAAAEANAADTLLEQQQEEFHTRLKTMPELVVSNQTTTAGQFGAMLAERELIKAKVPDLEPLMASIEQSYRSYNSAISRKKATEAALDAANNQIKQLRSDLEDSQKYVGRLFTAIKTDLNDINKARIENALYELKPSAGRLSQIIYFFVTVQPDVLTLTLVVSMGVLGSALQMTHTHFKRAVKSRFGGHFLQICVGAIAALVIFVVAKAGIPVVTDATKMGSEAPINPYFISFLAIISGLLSERAISFVQAQGERVFGPSTPDGPNRWVRQDLTEKVINPAQNLSPATLAFYLGLPQATMDGILKGEQAADPQQQKLIAIYLRESPRDLFTDIAPAGSLPQTAMGSSRPRQG
jgi:exonuclease VII small subunit